MYQFNKINGETIDYLSYTKNIVKKFPSVKIHVGTDSFLLNDNTRYITAIAFRFNKAGVHYIYTKKKFPRIKDNWERLWRETELSVDIARQLDKQKVKIEIDMDYNSDENHRSHKLISATKGWANSLGYKVNVKPNNQIATRAADHHCK